MAIDPNLTRDELQQLLNEVSAALRNIEQAQQTNEQTLKDAATVDADIDAVVAHAGRVRQILTAPTGQPLGTVEVGVKWLAEALYAVGALSIRTARIAAGRTDTTTTLPPSGG